MGASIPHTEHINVESASPVWVVDEQQRITQMNAAARALFNIPDGESVAGRPCHEVIRGRRLDGITHCQMNCDVRQQVDEGEPAPAVKLLLPLGGDESPSAHEAAGMPRWVPCDVQHVVMRHNGDEGGSRLMHVARDLERTEAVLRFSEQVLAAAQRFLTSGGGDNPMRKLTPQERRVLAALADGHDTPTVAEMLGVSKSTVRNHTQHILKKLNVHSRLEAVALVQPFLQGESIRTNERALDLMDL